MKKLILIAFVLFGLMSEAQVSRIYTVDKTTLDSKAYRKRVVADAGLIRTDNVDKAFRAMAIQNEIYNNIQFAWFGESGYKHRVASATAIFWSKLYSSKGTNDATQTTELSQPYLSGNIAPNERYALNNQNGSSKFITHPTISFAANEAWSVTTVLNWNGVVSSAFNSLYGDVNTHRVSIRNSGINRFGFQNSINAITNSTFDTSTLIGKNVVLTVVSSGTQVMLYINGVFISAHNADTSISFNTIFYGRSTNYLLDGKLYAHIIRSGALTQSQVTNEYNFFRSIYPEIETVKIGSQEWATSNLEMVSTPMGNPIANVTDNTAWAASTTTYDATYAATTGTVEQKTYAAVKAAAMWSYYNNDAALGAIYGKLYNWYAAKLLQMDIDYYNAANPTTPWGYRVPASTDFTTLQTTLGGAAVAGGKMKKEGLNYWNSPNTGADNSSGFSALGAGARLTNGTFGYITYNFDMLSLIEVNNTEIVRFELDYTNTIISFAARNKINGYSIRLIKN